MAAIRERYSKGLGIGHANRPWRHHAIGLDARPRRVRLSSTSCSLADANTNTGGYAHTYAYFQAYSNTQASLNGDTAPGAHMKCW